MLMLANPTFTKHNLRYDRPRHYGNSSAGQALQTRQYRAPQEFITAHRQQGTGHPNQRLPRSTNNSTKHETIPIIIFARETAAQDTHAAEKVSWQGDEKWQ